ncbi:hypothetical protein [Pontibaca salina]|uniref:Uncharacterized protein n=1 Tax=Pontibaca salina TaxID=2795731 RepID=A0A934LZ53_9RHOB|nr:hypothetical protein [Pontibaca salina]MBI6628303.1 hypothetical protein [Pontibaca salina]
MKPKLILHIGTFKTASGTLQSLLAAQREQLLAKGFLYADTSRPPHSDKPSHSSLVWATVSGAAAFDIEYHTILDEFRNSGASTLILSEEGFSNLREGHALMGRYKDDFDVEVVCYLRRQDYYAESLWNQFSREGKVKQGIQPFIRQPRIRNRFDYLSLLEFWQTVGVVHAYSFEDVVASDGIVADFARVSGIPLEGGEVRKNVSPSMEFAAVLAAANRYVRVHVPKVRQHIEKELGKNTRKQALGSRLRRELLDEFADHNLRLAEQYGVRFSVAMPDEPVEPLRIAGPKRLARFADILGIPPGTEFGKAAQIRPANQ